MATEPLLRIGETAELGGLLLQTLALNGWEPTVTGRPEGGVRVTLRHPNVAEPVTAEGDSLSAIAPELVKRAVTAARGRTGQLNLQDELALEQACGPDDGSWDWWWTTLPPTP